MNNRSHKKRRPNREGLEEEAAMQMQQNIQEMQTLQAMQNVVPTLGGEPLVTNGPHAQALGARPTPGMDGFIGAETAKAAVAGKGAEMAMGK